MDSHSPSTYIEHSPEASFQDTQAFIYYVRSLGTKHVIPVVTPRFAISCSSDLLALLGNLVQVDPSLMIQTHISENLAEIELTKKLFPLCKSYADVYDSYGLLQERTILAHAIHLTDEEVQLIKRRGAGISHCPTSNLNLRSGCANVGKYLDIGIKVSAFTVLPGKAHRQVQVGLGTDCSGGYSPSILTAIQHASIVSKILAMQKNPTASSNFEGKQLPLPTLVYLATLGGARVCHLDQETGSVEPGKSFDALLVSMPPPFGESEGRIASVTGFSDYLERFLFGGDERNISTVWVQGKVIGGTRHRPFTKLSTTRVE
jgi:guanine deaminase